MFSSGFYMFIYCEKKKMNCFVPAKGTHQVAHMLRLGFIFDEVRTLLTVCS